MALDQDTARASGLTPRQKYFPARADVVFYKGAIVCKRKGSKLAEIPDPLNPRTDLIPLGTCMYPLDMTDKSDGEFSVCVESGIKRDFSTGTGDDEITADMVGETFYLYDDDTLYATDVGGTLSPGGQVVFVDTSDYDGSVQVTAYFDWEQAALLEAVSAVAADVADIPTVQAGTGTLAAGTAVIAATITATSRIVVTMKDPGAGAITGFADFDVPAGTRVVGAPGSFTVNAIDDAKALIATAVCTFDWVVIG